MAQEASKSRLCCPLCVDQLIGVGLNRGAEVILVSRTQQQQRQEIALTPGSALKATPRHGVQHTGSDHVHGGETGPSSITGPVAL